jgi:SH3-like domain-containing protein
MLFRIPKLILAGLLLPVVFFPGCRRGAKITQGEPAYVTAPQVNLRDRLSAIYNKTGTVKNGERVEILEKNKRFVRVRSPRGEEGWIETRYLAGSEVFDALDHLVRENANAPIIARGVTRAELKMHVTPGRDTDALFRIDEGAKVDLLKRTSVEKPQNKLVPVKAENDKPAAPPPPPPLEDWWLVRDAQGHAGWVLARMIDIDVPTEVAQYAEGQRIMSALVINRVSDTDPATGQTREVAQFLTLVNDPKDGTPWDYNQIRVFTWNPKRHRYETAYRERNLFGLFPATVSHEVFDKEGDLPTFTVHVKDDTGAVIAKKYRLNQPIVQRVFSPEEQRQRAEGKLARPAKTGTHQTHHRRH